MKISVRSPASGEWQALGHVNFIVTDAFGTENFVSGLYQSMEHSDFLSNTGNFT